MSANPQIDLQVDQHALREEVKAKYREVATDPHAEFHFTTGRALAKRLGYAFIARRP